jgi:hypothetical protein
MVIGRCVKAFEYREENNGPCGGCSIPKELGPLPADTICLHPCRSAVGAKKEAKAKEAKKNTHWDW